MTDATEISTTAAELQELAAKLDAFEHLTERERVLLGGVFALAGQAAVEQADDVTGFMPTAVERTSFNLPSSLPGYLGPTSSLPAVQRGTIFSGFTNGLNGGGNVAHGAGGGGGAG